jgi:hypothetical protein
VQHRFSLYVETPVFGFYFDRRETKRSKREAARRLFAPIRLRTGEPAAVLSVVSEGVVHQWP